MRARISIAGVFVPLGSMAAGPSVQTHTSKYTVKYTYVMQLEIASLT